MKVAIDLDGVAFKHKKLILPLWRMMQEMGWEVGVLTAHMEDLIYVDIFKLKEMGYPDPDFFIHREPHEKLVGEFKRDAVKEFEIDILIDDFGGDNQGIKESYFKDNDSKCILLQVYPGED